jgi:hypothetical protein
MKQRYGGNKKGIHTFVRKYLGTQTSPKDITKMYAREICCEHTNLIKVVHDFNFSGNGPSGLTIGVI